MSTLAQLTLAIDPGLRGCGVAWFEGPELQLAAYVVNPERSARGPAAWRAMARAVDEYVGLTTPRTWWGTDRLVVEMQHIYQVQRRGKAFGADPNDLLQVAGVAGALTLAIDAPLAIGVEPAEWKGQVDKVICQLRVNKRLSPQETARMVMPTTRAGAPSELQHNVYDAVGIGLWAVGRWRGETHHDEVHLGRGAATGGAGGAPARSGRRGPAGHVST